MRRFIIAAFALTILAACQPVATELTVEQKAEIAAEVGLVVSQFLDAFRDGDFDRGMEYWLDSPDAAYANQGGVNFGYDNLVSLYGPVFERIASQTIRVSDQRIDVLARNVVQVIAHSSFTQTDTDGVTGPERQVVQFTIWVRRDDGWKVLSIHESLRPISAPENP